MAPDRGEAARGIVTPPPAISRTEIKKALSLVPGGYQGTGKEKANVRKRESSKKQAQLLIEQIQMNEMVYNSITEAISDLRSNGGPSRSWWYKENNSFYLTSLMQNVKHAKADQSGGDP